MSYSTSNINARRMNAQAKPGWLAATLCAAILIAAVPARAEMSAEELAKLAQNPVGNLISLPFQNNTNLNVGPEKGTQNILNIQPVYPIEVNKDWNLITRTIIPLIWQPGFAPGQGTEFGLGDIQLSGFLSPSEPGPGGLIWGAGAIAQMPTDTNDLGNKNWELGPTVVVLRIQHGDPWVYGVLANNIWSLTSDKQGGAYNNGLIQPYAPSENLVAVADAPPTIDATLRAAFEKAAIYYPFTDLIVADPFAALTDGAILAFTIGQSDLVGGTRTDMVAWASDDVFLQIWIGADDKLPRRIRAVYRTDPYALGHQMGLSNWQLDGTLAPDAFMSQKAQSAKRIAFANPAGTPTVSAKPPAKAVNAKPAAPGSTTKSQ